MARRTNVFSETREKLITRCEAWKATHYPNLKVFYENGPSVNWDAQTADFVMVRLRFPDSSQASLEQEPIYRIRGWLDIACYVKEYSGTARAYTMVDTLLNQFRFHQEPGLVTHAPYLHKPMTVEGWHILELSVGFAADSVI